jgi:hypothetical protein
MNMYIFEIPHIFIYIDDYVFNFFFPLCQLWIDDYWMLKTHRYTLIYIYCQFVTSHSKCRLGQKGFESKCISFKPKKIRNFKTSSWIWIKF